MALINLSSTQLSSPENLQKWLNGIGITTIVKGINYLAAKQEVAEREFKIAASKIVDSEAVMRNTESAMWFKFNKFYLEMKEMTKKHEEQFQDALGKQEQIFDRAEENRNVALKIAASTSKTVANLEERIAALEKEIEELKNR